MNNTDFEKTTMEELNRIYLANNEQSVSLLNNFIDSLSTTNRKVFIKRYCCYNDIKDIAASMSISENTVKNILLRTCGELEVYIYSSGLTANVDDDATNYQNVMNVIKKVNNEFIKEATSGADIEVNDEAETVNDNAPKKKLSLKQKVYIGVAALATVVVLILVGMGVSQETHKKVLPKLDVPYLSEDIMTDKIEYNISYELPSITYNGDVYTALHTYVELGTVQSSLESQIISLIGNASEELVTLYNLYNISSDLIIGVSFDNVDTDPADLEMEQWILPCYLYINSSYKPETLEGMLEDLNLDIDNDCDEFFYYRNRDNENEQIIYCNSNIVGGYFSDIVFENRNLSYMPCSNKDLKGVYLICIRYRYMCCNDKIRLFMKEDGTTIIDFYGQKYKFKADATLIDQALDKIIRYCEIYEVDYFPEF